MATGPTSVKTAPLKTKSGEVIIDQRKQLQRRVEHYLKLYSTQNIMTDAALDALPGLPAMEDLDEIPDYRSSAKPLTTSPVARRQGWTAYQQKF